jgi:predicted DNA-binding protein (MmcQ/YjbR family)
MNIESLREYCLSKKGTSEDTPFDEHTLCLRVGKKIFAITGLDQIELRVNLKCDPERAIDLRERYENIIPGYHMNKKLWNTVIMDESLDDAFYHELIDHSYDLIYKSLTKKIKAEIENGSYVVE